MSTTATAEDVHLHIRYRPGMNIYLHLLTEAEPDRVPDTDGDAKDAGLEGMLARLARVSGPRVREFHQTAIRLGYRSRLPVTDDAGKSRAYYVRYLDPESASRATVFYLTPTSVDFSRPGDRAELAELEPAIVTSRSVAFRLASNEGFRLAVETARRLKA